MVLSIAVAHPSDPAEAALKRRLLDMGVHVAHVSLLER